MPFAKDKLQTEHTFTVTTTSGDMPFVVTKQALDEFELQGLAAMDDVLNHLSDRHTPSNAPHERPIPLNLVGQMILDGLSNGNMRKIMICALWLGHHYPSVDGVSFDGWEFSFSHSQTQPTRSAALN